MSSDYCLFAIDTLYAHLHAIDPVVMLPDSPDEYPLFVTWKTATTHSLRGCIGTFSPIRLTEGLRHYALKSALEDGRFAPVRIDELPQLVCSVSLLTDYEACGAFDDWAIGTHGVSCELVEDGHRHHAVFLPEVMLEHGLNQRDAVASLLKKGGYHKRVTDVLLERVVLTRFQSQRTSLSVADYLQMTRAMK